MPHLLMVDTSLGYRGRSVCQ